MTSSRVVIDNDVVFKLSAYRQHDYLSEDAAWAPGFILPVAKFVLRDLARKSRRVSNRDAVSHAIDAALESLGVVHPSEEAISLAAALEEEANAKAFELDTGESQLLALILLKEASLMLTGDKRAVKAIEHLSQEGSRGRIASLEHVLVELLECQEFSELKNSVCAEAKIDSAVTSCFACYSPTATAGNVKEGLDSYIRALNALAPSVLCKTRIADAL